MYKVITFSTFGEQTVTEVEGKSMTAVAKKFKYCIVDKDGKYARYFRGVKITAKPEEHKIWRDGKQAFLVTLKAGAKKFQEVHFDNRYLKIEPRPKQTPKPKIAHYPFLEAKHSTYKEMASKYAEYVEKPEQPKNITASTDETNDLENGWTLPRTSNPFAELVTGKDWGTLGDIAKNSGNDSAKNSDLNTWKDGTTASPSELKKVFTKEEFDKMVRKLYKKPPMPNYMIEEYLKSETEDKNDTLEGS